MRRDHRLAAGLVDVPRVDAAGVDFRDGPGQRVLADSLGKLAAPLGRQLLRIVEADDAALRIQNHGARDHRAEQRSAPRFVKPGDAQPAALARFALVSSTAEPSHRRGF